MSTVLFWLNIVLVIFFKTNGISKIFQWLCNLLSSNALLWAVLGKPVYGYLFRRDAFLAEFKQGLRDEGFLTHASTKGDKVSTSVKLERLKVVKSTTEDNNKNFSSIV